MIEKAFRIIKYAFFAVALLLIFIVVASFFIPSLDKEFNKKIESRIVAGDRIIPLKELTDFEWERVCYIKEYALETPGGTKAYGFDFDSYLGRKYDGPYPRRDVCDTNASNDLFFVGENGFTRLIALDRCPEGKLENLSHECFEKDVVFQVNEVEHAGRRYKQLTFKKGESRGRY